MKKILFVCTGNTCRSSMAEAIAKEIFKKNNKTDYEIISAGIAAIKGEPASINAVQALDEIGINLNTHQATQLSPGLIDQADIILTMTNTQKNRVLELVPNAKNKVFLLKEVADELNEIQKLQDKQKEIYHRITEKKRTFLNQNYEILQQLEYERKELMQRIQEIDMELIKLENKLKELTQQEYEELERIENKLMSLEISDPFSSSSNVYRKCRDELLQVIEKIVDKL